MTSLRPNVLYVGRPPMRLVHALAMAGFDVNLVNEAQVHAGMTGGELLLLSFEDHDDPLSLMARLWSAEPDLTVVTLDDGDREKVRASLRVGVAASVPPPHYPDEVVLAVRQAWQRKTAGAFEYQRNLARTMSSLAAFCGAATSREFLQPVLDQLARLFDVGRASIMLVEEGPDGRHLVIGAHRGLDTDVSAIRVPLGEGIAGRVAQEGIPQLLVRSSGGVTRYSNVAANISASISVPIRTASDAGRSSVGGVLNLARVDGIEIFTPYDLEVCEFAAALIGQTIARVDLDLSQADLQEKMAATEKLAYAGEVAAGIAHEVASPIGYLKANIKVLADYAEDLAPILEELRQTRNDPIIEEVAEDLPCLIDECRTGIERATHIVRDMKAMVRVDSGKQPKQPVAMAEMVNGALRLLRPRLADRCKIDLVVDETMVVMGNEVELSQVLVNLVVNGLDACLSRQEAEPDHQPVIKVRVERHGEDCVLSVADNGTGISARDQARIFAPLFTTKPNGVGTGLGLGVVKRVVTSHDGSLELASNLGEGTTFRLIFPALSSAADTAAAKPETALPA
jgi:signal transduction histidine kinase